MDTFLDREKIEFDSEFNYEYLYNKVVMVTGAGSIGSEICRKIAKSNPKRIIIVDIYENNAYNIQQELLYNSCSFDIEVCILSITNYEILDNIFKNSTPDIVFHTAAHKHVPLMEHNVKEAILNNIFGTYNVMLLAGKYNVEKFVLISTDKAVNPTSVMGMTKLCCEKIMKFMNKKFDNTQYYAVRFGNVLGSNGSVIPLFKKQIENGGPVTVTHKDMMRYFMTIPEAVNLVLKAGSWNSKSDIFVLDMGKQVNITCLAEKLIKEMGYVPYEEIDIIYTGLRDGEKLFEELISAEEELLPTECNRIMKIKSNDIDCEILEKELLNLQNELKLTNNFDNEKLKGDLKKLINNINN